MTGSGLRNELPGRSEGSDPTRSPEARLMDTVARLQLVEALKFGQLGRSTSGGQTSPFRSKPVVFTSTKVPKFCWSDKLGTIPTSVWGDRTVEWVGRRYGCSAAVVLPGGRRVKRDPVGTRGEASHADQTGRGTYRTLWVTGSVSGLSTSVWEDGPEGKGGPVHFCHSARDISC